MNTAHYLDRINYQGLLDPTLDTLTNLQEQHLLNVPFENLDIHYNRFISLEKKARYAKVIRNKRGGFCYELNSLFFDLLTQLGYDVKMISACVFNVDKQIFGAKFDHLALLVCLEDQEYLVDVGFGEFTLSPIPINLNAVHADPTGQFIIEKNEDGNFLVSKITESQKRAQYIFSKKEHQLADFTEMCHYHQTNQESSFTQKLVISKATLKGRITLTKNKLKITEDGKITKEKALSPADFSDALFTYFGILESELK